MRDTARPSDIVREHNDEVTTQHVIGCGSLSVDGAVAEDFLQRLLSALARLCDVTSGSTARDATTLPLLLLLLLQDCDGSSEDQKSFLGGFWSLLTGQSSTMPPLRADASSSSSIQNEWVQGLQMAARLAHELSPTALHATVASGLVFGGGGSNNNDGGRRNATQAFPAVCLVLCCYALHSCPHPVHQRWKRWQSLQMETLRLYQKYYGSSGLENDDSPNTVAWELWCDFVLPATAHVQRGLVAGATPLTKATSSSKSAFPHWMAWQAGVIHCASRLAITAIVDNAEDCGRRGERDCPRLFAIVDEHVLRGQHELLLEHPLRRAGSTGDYGHQDHDSPADPSEATAALTFYTTSSPPLASRHEPDDEQHRRESALDVQTQWSDAGVAILAAAGAWPSRPLVVNGLFQWRLFFPHVAILLLGKWHEDDREEGNGRDHVGVNMMVLGVHLLRELLQVVPYNYLSAPQNRDAPLSPIGTCQLLLNRILVASSLEAKDGEPHSVLPDSAHAFQLAKQLVAKYRPGCQFAIVRQLVEECPHPGLVPKLLDVLRNFVGWHDAEAEEMVWRYLEATYLESLDAHVAWETHASNQVGTATESLRNVEDLIDTVEIYTAVLGLVRIWSLGQRPLPPSLTLPTASDLVIRLRRLHRALRNTSKHWQESSSVPNAASLGDGWVAPPAESHRLSLLDIAVQLTIEALMAMDRKS